MKQLKWVLAGLVLAASNVANAGEFSATVTATSDYDFRGTSLSAKDPALQASIDWAADSGLYVGAWASNIDYGTFEDDEGNTITVDGDIELDLYAGWAGEFGGGVGWDAGAVWYLYPGSSSSATKVKIEDYPELWFGISYGIFDAKQWWAIDYGGGSDDAFYTEANLNFELPANFTAGVHLGYNYGDGITASYGDKFLDYAAFVGYSFGHFDLELRYTATDLSGDYKITDDVFNTEGRVIFSISTTFPW
jgi:uncharacterized protein (TIGR02001 family)